MNNMVDVEVKNAYADCWMDDLKVAYELRNLDFRASAPVSKQEAISIMSKYVSGGYNEFTPELLNFLPDDSKVTIAREGSVCIYFNSEELNGSSTMQDTLPTLLRADDFDYNGNEYRIWWD
jgi:hypothetical protein